MVIVWQSQMPAAVVVVAVQQWHLLQKIVERAMVVHLLQPRWRRQQINQYLVLYLPIIILRQMQILVVLQLLCKPLMTVVIPQQVILGLALVGYQ